MAKITETIPFTFNDLFEESKGIFEDAGFDVSDGSNTTQLSAVMSYLVSALNTNTAININETLLPYATKRKNIIQDARVLGYEPTRKTSYQYRIKIRLDDKMCGYGSFTLKKFSSITANGNTYYYMGTANDNIAYANTDLKINLGVVKINDKVVLPSDIVFDTDNPVEANSAMYGTTDITEQWKKVVIEFRRSREFEVLYKEGELITFEDDVANLKQTIGSVTINGNTYTRNYVDVPYTDVENDGIECLVSYYDTEGTLQQNVLFEKTENYFFEVDGNDLIDRAYLRRDDIEMGTPRLYFSYAGMGKGIPYGSVVKLNILVTHATSGGMGDLEYETVTKNDESFLSYKGINLPSIPSDSGDISNVLDDAIITACDLVKTGTEEESNTSIQQNAPKVYNSAYRLITNLDYKSACNRSTFVKDSAVWGGEDEFPKAPGHIWFSFLPEKTSERTFTSNKDNSEYQRDNSILLYNFQEGETKYQYALRQAYYQKNYILNTEIKSCSIYKDHSGFHIKYGGVWGDLINHYVPSLTFHHRNPLFLNFNYEFNILKYNLKQTNSEVHSELFNALNNCFYDSNGENPLNLESFDTEYFHSNIIKRIDNLISDLCGFTSTLKTQIILNEKTLCTENWDPNYKDIYIPLCVPFEKYFRNNGFLDFERLPNIDTKNFIDFRFDKIIPPLEEQDYTDGPVIGKYDYLRFSAVQGDLFTDWGLFEIDQLKRFSEILDDPGVDCSDLSTKVFVVPVKVKMHYKYYVSTRFKTQNENYIQLGFKLAPDNTLDESFKGIKVFIYGNDYEEDGDNTPLHSFGEDCDYPLEGYFSYNSAYRERLIVTQQAKDLMPTGGVVEVSFVRTCGYYYLFNTFRKEILIHLFVTGSYEGFSIAKNGMKNNEYYDHYLDELGETWAQNESEFNDETLGIDITYSSPRSYLYTTDRRYLVTSEPTGKELEAEKHPFNYGVLGDNGEVIQYQSDGKGYEIPSAYNERVKEALRSGLTINEILERYPGIASDTDDRDDPEESSSVSHGHYLTTEGYLSEGEEDFYSGPIVRQYNENMYLYTPLTVDLFRQNVYLNVNYPSENFKVHRNVIPRLNNVKFKNAVELY
jgi:hypothetical protein